MASLQSSVLAEKLSLTRKDNTALIAVCQDIASEIQIGKINISTFVEQLGPLLTSKDVDTREHGVEVLSSVLAQIPKDFLNETELHFLTTFYCDRLKDHHSIIPVAIDGILALVQMHYLPQDSPSRLIRVMFEHVSCQSQLLRNRRNIYLVISVLLQNRLNDLKSMSLDFIYGFICAIDGERDPRNLMLLFNLLPNFLKEFSLGHLTEEMFEVIACYFPVDFNPSGSEGVGVTRNDLAEALTPCLCAIPEFAEFCLPLITDKLMSSLRVAKIDSLNLLCAGAKTFQAKGMQSYLSELWSALRKEVMPGGDTEIANIALKAVATIVNVISTDEVICESFIENIITDTKSSLCDVQLSLFRPAKKILMTIASVNKKSCIRILRVIVPLCLGQYSTKTSLEDKLILIDTLNSFIKISSDLGFSIKSIPELAWTDIPQLYLEELTTQFIELKNKLLIGLTIQQAFLNIVHRTELYDVIYNEINMGHNDVRNTCHMCLLELSSSYPEETLTFVKEKLQTHNNDITPEILIHRLEALSAIAKTHELINEIVPKIVIMIVTSNLEISYAALMCIHKLLSTTNNKFNIQYFLYHNCHIIDMFTTFKIEESDKRLLPMINICQSVVRHLTLEEQQIIVNRYNTLLLDTLSETDTVLIMSLFIPLRPSVNFNVDHFVECLHSLAIKHSNINVRQTACKLLSVLLNKMDDNENFEKHLYDLRQEICNIFNSDVNVETKQAAIMLLIWLTKAVIVKGSRKSECFLNHLCETFINSELGPYIAQEYKILTSRTENILVQENFCNVKILYKQRVFQHFIQQNNNFDNSLRQNYLIALITLLENVSVDLLFMHLEDLVPLLIESLSLNNGDLVLSTLTILKMLLDSKNVIFSDKAQSFIPRLLKLTTYETMRVRIAALDCLASYCNYPTFIIITYKQDVLDKLATVIDDRKRLVRKSAVVARTRWFLVGAPGGIKDQ